MILKIMKFWSNSCTGCKALQPSFEKFVEDNPDINVQEVNITEDMGIARDYDVMGLPTIILFDDDNYILVRSMAHNMSEIEQYIQ